LEAPATYSNKVDIWAFGCVLYELVNGEVAFPREWDTVRFMMDPTNSEISSKNAEEDYEDDGVSSREMWSLIRTALRRNPSDRPPAIYFFHILGELCWKAGYIAQGKSEPPTTFKKADT